MSTAAPPRLNAAKEAARLRSMGFALCKPDPGTKNPTAKGWSTRTLEPCNFKPGDPIGILGGPLSNATLAEHAVVIIDLDSAEANRRADDYLPATRMVEGRTSKPRSHRYYLVPCESVPSWGVSTAEQGATAAKEATGFAGPFLKHFAHRETKKGVLDFIGTGGQVVCPPSKHPDGEVREWEGGELGEPSIVSFLELWAAVGELASACGAGIPQLQSRLDVRVTPSLSILERAKKYLKATPGAISGQGGHKQTFSIARAMVFGFDLSPDESLRLLLEEYNPRCEPPWNEKDLHHKIEDADRLPFSKERGHLANAHAPGLNGKSTVSRPPAEPALAAEPVEAHPAQAWPLIDKAAFDGPAGELVRVIEPHTEADPVAILLQTLIGFGNMIGRTAFHQHEADQHFTNEYLVLVGDTADGRKGTSWGHVQRTLAEVDPAWAQSRIASGLSSGEGLLQEVRDQRKDDEGVSDKRLLVHEPEFANVLRMFERQGNILSAMLRSAWDGRPLRVLTKGSPARCNAPHISIIGHITGDELRRLLATTDTTNGVANRHLFALVKRSKMLPHGGNLNLEDLKPVEEEMRLALDFSRGLGRMDRTEDARDFWVSVYPRLSTGRPGVSGAISARALAHVTRLSVLYATLDRSEGVDTRHLRAALACWDYVAASVLHVFGDSTGDKVADEIRDLLREAGELGVKRSDIREYFKRNRSAEELDRALGLLQKMGTATFTQTQTGERGRPPQTWFAVR